MALTSEQIQAFIAASERATNGPWDTGIGGVYVPAYGKVGNPNVERWICEMKRPNFINNAEFIAQSRNLMPELAEEWKQQKDEIQRKDAQIQRMREALEGVQTAQSKGSFYPMEYIDEALADIGGKGGMKHEP